MLFFNSFLDEKVAEYSVYAKTACTVLYLSHEKMNEIRGNHSMLNEWINDYAYARKSRRYTILDYIHCQSKHSDST